MSIIAFVNPKGGTGKTTGALVLATTLARYGASVTAVDCDPNANLVAWKDGPSQSPIEVIRHTDETTIGRALKGAATRAQFVIVDLEGAASYMVATAVRVADLTIIPMQGSEMDARQAKRALELLEDQAAASGPRPYRVMFTRTKPGFATRDERAIREKLAEAKVPMMDTDLAERAAYRSMFTYRQALDELDPQAVNGLDKARENADALANEVIEILRTSRESAHV